MSKLASQEEIKKAIPFLEAIKWQVQNDKQDKDTGFIYHCQRVGQVVDLALSNDIDVGYAVHRWYNFQCSKWAEEMFCEFGAIHYEDEKDHDIDLTICGVPFDIKLSVISSNYKGNTDLTNRENKNSYIKWLIGNASQESRKHTANKIFVICDNLHDKCDFDRIRAKTKAFMDYFAQNIDNYTKSNVCELIYIKN